MENQRNKNIFLDLVSDDENFMHSLVENIQLLRTEYGWSVRVLAEKADMSIDTLQNILKGKAKDCNLSTVIRLAKAFEISLDELVGSNTLRADAKEALGMIRGLDPHVQKVIFSYARRQAELHSNKTPGEKDITVICPICENGRLMRGSLIDEKISLKNVPSELQGCIDFGMKIPCDHYDPYFLKGEIILLAFEREGQNNEPCVVSVDGNYYICIKHIKTIDGKKEVIYRAITNNRQLFRFDDIELRHGYIVGFLHPNGDWGAR